MASCTFKIANNKRAEERFMFGGLSMERDEYEAIIEDVKNNIIRFERFPFIGNRLLNSFENVSRVYKKIDLLDQIKAMKIANELDKKDFNDSMDLFW